MNIISKKNYLMFFAAIVFFLFVYMGFTIFVRNRNPNRDIQREVIKIQTQSESTDINSIEKDLLETDLENLDSELDSIEKELNSAG